MKTESLQVWLKRLGVIALVALAYYLAARLGMLLGQPPDYIPVFWPAAGVALAAVLIGGRQMAFGIAIGAFVIGLHILHGAFSAPLALVAALGAAFQVLAGAYLLQRLVREIPPARINLIVYAMGLCALIALMGPLVTVGVLYLDGILSAENPLLPLWKTWLAVYIGLLMVTPVLTVAARRAQHKTVPDPLLVILPSFMLGLALFTFVLAWNDAEQKLGERLQRDTTEMVHVVRDTVANDEYALRAIGAFFDASEDVTRAEFNRFVTPLLATASAAESFGWVPRVSNSERAAFEQAARADGLNNFSITERNAQGERVPAFARDEYFPLAYVVPDKSGQTVLGFDLSTVNDVAQAMQRASNTGNITLIPAPAFEQTTTDQNVWMLLLPVYRRDAQADSTETRRENLLGFAYIVFQLNNLVQSALAQINPHDLDFYILDSSTAPSKLLTALSNKSGAQSLPTTTDPTQLQNQNNYSYSLELFGRAWEFLTNPSSAYVNESRSVAWLTLLIGLTITGAFILYMNSRQQAEDKLRANERRSQLLLTAIPDLMFRVNPDGRVLDYAAQTNQDPLLQPSDLIGKNITDIFPQAIADQYRQAIHAAFDTGHLQTFEYQLDSTNGSAFYEARIATNAEANEAVAIVRDITEHRLVAQALQQSQEHYRLISENSGELIWVVDLESRRFTYVSPSVEKLRGKTAQQMMAQPIGEAFTPESLARINAVLPERLAAFLENHNAITYTDEVDLFRPDGSIMHTEIASTFVVNNAGKIQVVAITRDITERKQAEKLLQQSQKSLEMAQELAHLGSWEFDPTTGIGFWSREMFRLFGRDPADGMPVPDEFFELIEPADRERLLQAQTRAIDTGERVTLEYRSLPTANGTRHFEATLHAIKDAHGQLIRMAGTALDITERKQNEARLRRLNRTYAVLSEVNETIVRVRDPQTLFQAACRIAVEHGKFRMAWFGIIDPETNQVRPVAHAGETDGYLEKLDITLDDSPRGHGPTATALRAGQHIISNDIATDPRMGPWRQDALALGYRSSGVFPVITQNRLHGALSLYASEPYFFDDAEIKLLEEMANDIAFALEFGEQEKQRAQAEAELRASERRSQTLLQAIPDLMFRMTRDGIILDYAAQETQKLYAPPEIFLGKNIADIMPPAIVAQWHTAVDKAFETGTLQTYEYQLDVNGIPQFFEARVSINVNENEVVVIVRDITQAHQNTEQIRQFSRVIDQMDDVVVITDVNGIIVYVNPSFERRTGYTRAEAIGKTPRILKSGLEPQSLYAKLWSTILRGESFQSELRNRKKNGELYYESKTITPIRDAHGVCTHFVATGRDITARKQMERDLQERLKEMTCLRQVQRLLEQDLPTDELFAQTAHYLEAGMQFPEISVGVIELDGATYGSSLSTEPIRSLCADIVIGDTVRGILQLHYTQDQSFILPEEQDLLDSLAQTIGLSLERRYAQEALAEERNSLSRRVAERTADLIQANNELARAARMKDEFLSSMSHELRTPLNGILGLSESLEEGVYGPLTPEQLTPLRTVAEAGHHLLELINDILDLSKIEAGRLELHPDAVHVETVCQASLRMIKQPAQHKHLRVSFSQDSNIGSVLADERRLKQMLVNLLGNAVKFTPEQGQVGLDVTLSPDSESIRFTVWDTGIGIPPEKQSLLFQPFTQIDSSLTRQYSGTGLGLSLVRRLAELHGGSVGVESEPGKGSRFYFDLPLIHTEPAQEDGTETASVLQIQIALVVDDSVTSSDTLTRYLRELGAQVTVEYDSEKAVERAALMQPDVIMLDLLMPNRSGWDVLAALKTDVRTKHIPVIITSVMEERARSETAGAAGYIVKPVTRESLRATLRRVLRAQTETASATGRLRSVESEKFAPALPPHAVPLILLAEDNLINQRTLNDFMTSKGYQVIVAGNGAEALERARASQPALILMDVQMPVMDGLEAMQRLRAEPQFVNTPIIAITALAMPGDRERCIAAGASDYMTKPVSLKRLYALVETMIGSANQKPTT